MGEILISSNRTSTAVFRKLVVIVEAEKIEGDARAVSLEKDCSERGI